jgi:hypothetical protein
MTVQADQSQSRASSHCGRPRYTRSGYIQRHYGLTPVVQKCTFVHGKRDVGTPVAWRLEIDILQRWNYAEPDVKIATCYT